MCDLGITLMAFSVGLCYVPSSFATILTRTRELVTLLSLSFGCLVTVNNLQFLLTVPWVGMQFVIVVFSDHTHLLFSCRMTSCVLSLFLKMAEVVGIWSVIVAYLGHTHMFYVIIKG